MTVYKHIENSFNIEHLENGRTTHYINSKGVSLYSFSIRYYDACSDIRAVVGDARSLYWSNYYFF